MIRFIINLMIITIERYLKVVHPFWSKKHLKRWMIYAAMVFAWIVGILTVTPIAFVTTVVKDGICRRYSVSTGTITSVWFTFSYFIVPVILFAFCYARILAVMRRQMCVMASHNTEGSSHMNASQIQSQRIKWNIIKTMIIVSVILVIYCVYFETQK